MGYADDIARFQNRVRRRAELLFRQLEEDVYDSIVEGSPVTGSKGQPVRTGRLKDSWEIETGADGLTYIFTEIPYAGKIERGNWKRRESKGGGPRSLSLTIAGWRNLVASALAKAEGG